MSIHSWEKMELSADQSRAHLDITHIQTPTCSISLFVHENCETSTHPDCAKWQHLSARYGPFKWQASNGENWAGLDRTSGRPSRSGQVAASQSPDLGHPDHAKWQILSCISGPSKSRQVAASKTPDLRRPNRDKWQHMMHRSGPSKL